MPERAHCATRVVRSEHRRTEHRLVEPLPGLTQDVPTESLFDGTTGRYQASRHIGVNDELAMIWLFPQQIDRLNRLV